MILKFTLKENDIFQMLLYSFKENNSLKKIIIKNLITWFVIYLIIISILFFNNQKLVSVIILFVAIMTLIILPFSIKDIYFKRLRKQTKLYVDKFDKVLTLETVNNSIKILGNEFESKISITTIEKIVETKLHFFIVFKPEVFVIPKSEIEDLKFVKNELFELNKKQNVVFENRLNWKW